MSIGRGLAAGLIGGLAAAGAMSAGHAALSAVAPPPPPQQGEDATVTVASAVARALGRTIPEDDKPVAGSVVHYAFGAAVGAAYGGLSEVVPVATRGVGLPFGAVVWLGAHAATVPALGLAPPPWRRPGAETTELLLHLLYGAVTELIRRGVRRIF